MKRLIPIIVTTMCLLLGYYFGTRNALIEVVEKQTLVLRDNKINEVLSIMDGMYVDTLDIDSIIEKSIPKLLTELDPHSVYIPIEEVEETNSELESSFSGIGIRFTIQEDTINISDVIRNGPSEKVGLTPGDRIISIDGKSVAGGKFPQDSMIRLLRGASGTKVNLTVKREKELVDFTIVRGKIPVKSIDVAYMINDTTGYIKLSKFSKSSYMEFLEAIVKLTAKGMDKLIFDLRDNPGGYLDQALYLSNEFLKKDELIVYMEGLHRERQDFKATGKGLIKDVELVVLINEGSASSSEIFAGAIQDNDRGLIVGRRSYGKGLVQEPVYFSDNSGIRLTVAKYYTPDGRYIQKPYVKGDDEGYSGDLVERYLHGEMMDKDSIPEGGGGIIPDIFVPIDTVGVTDMLVKINQLSLQTKFSIEMSDRYRKELQGVSNIEELNALLDDMELESRFKAYMRKNNVPVVKAQWEISGDIVMTQIRAMVGRYSKLEDEAFYPIIAKIDNVIQRVI